MSRRLWIDTRGRPAFTSTRNGEQNAKRWGWTEAVAVPTTTANLDADHAVALEREAIATWHERQARAAQECAQGLPPQSNRRQLLMEDFAVHKTAAQAIRNGQHHAPAEEQK